MASAGEAATGGEHFTEPLVVGELEQEINTDLHDLSTSENLKKEEGEAERKEKKEGMEKLKSSLVVSGVVITVIGAIFALAKKIKEA